MQTFSFKSKHAAFLTIREAAGAAAGAEKHHSPKAKALRAKADAAIAAAHRKWPPHN